MRDDVPPEPTDPVALSLALWLGLLVAIGGVKRLAEHAPPPPAARASALAQTSMIGSF